MSAWKEAKETLKAAGAYVDKRLESILLRLKALEDRALVPGPPGEKGNPGKDGESVNINDILPVIKAHFSEWVLNWEKEARAILEKIVEKIPPPQKGDSGPKGERGEKGEPGPVGPEGKPGERGERGEKGEPGESIKGEKGDKGDPGRDGKDGVPGSQGIKGEDGHSVTIDEVMEKLEAHLAKWELEFERRAWDVLQKAIDKIPPPRDGKDGLPGKDGIDGKNGIDGKDGTRGLNGADGKNGIDGKDGLNGKDGKDGRDGKDGADGLNGKDGADGLGFNDLEVIQTDDRNFTIKFSRDGKEKEFRFSMPVLLYRGTYETGRAYQKGDSVTYGGSLWICQRDNPLIGPGVKESDWKLAVKRGKDGKGE